MDAEALMKANAKRPWTDEEDKLLLEAITKFGAQRWPLIASVVQRGRAGKQCRERWFNHLCPAVKKGEWTEEEDRLISEGVAELGTKWSEIVKRLPGRTDNAIKNRYNSQQRRLQRRARASAVAAQQHPQAMDPEGAASATSGARLHVSDARGSNEVECVEAVETVEAQAQPAEDAVVAVEAVGCVVAEG